MNLFDHFVFRNEVSPTAVWSTSSQWQQVSGQLATLKREDAYANAVLEFQTSNSGDYVATHDMKRSTLETFMLNELRFTGEHTALAPHQATINGNDLLFVDNLDGQLPRIVLEATAAQDAGSFTFRVESKLLLLNDLELSGDGSQQLEVSGAIVDYYEPRGVTKTGTSRVRLTGGNTYTGNTTVEAGELSISQPFLADTADVRLFSGATLELDFLGVDTISALFLDDSPQVVGTWGALGNAAADFQTALITGDGVLYVSSAVLPGDFNGDGSVDTADYVVWRKGLGTNYNQSHYDEWLANFGTDAGGGGSGNSAVPEPGSLSILFWLLAIHTSRCRRSRTLSTDGR
jgi:autotransporter-associated beta strand protein